MTDTAMDRIASDLGICHFIGEPQVQFECRVIYSAMASWIKAIAMDQTPGSRETGFYGVSRRHMYERGCAVLNAFYRMYPEITGWFDLTEEGWHPVKLLRARLLSHGDLLNEGFDTNVALSSVHSIPLTSRVETIYGEILGEGLEYSGVAVIRRKETEISVEKMETNREWMDNFLKEAGWIPDSSDLRLRQYFNPFSRTKNNYSAWQDSIPEAIHGIVLAREAVNRNSYEYYLIKSRKKLVHRLDPFLQQMGYHIRIMYGLRTEAENRIVAAMKRHDRYIVLRLNARLPLKENSLLESYAWPSRHINDKLGWIMNDFIWDYIEPYIDVLGIRILEDTDG